MAAIEIPERAVDATPGFVTAALHEGGVLDAGSRVAEVSSEEIGVGVGIVGQLARLTLRYEGTATGAPGSVILKLPSHFPENRAIGDHFNFFEREGRFYQQIGGKLGVRTPACYWNHLDAATGTFALLLEDLGARTMISQIAGMDGARAADALRCLAELHGAWWASPALDSLGWMPRLDDPINLAAGQQYRDAWPLFVERIGDAVPAEAIELGDRIKDAMEALLSSGIAEAPVTVCHGDFRVDNLLFDDAAACPDRVGVLDWQISFRGPAVTDVAYLLCQSMRTEDRRVEEVGLIDHWYGAVAGARGLGSAMPDYPRDLAWQHYRRSTLGNTVYPVTAMGAMDLANERGVDLVRQMASRAFAAALDLDAAELLPHEPGGRSAGRPSLGDV
jgi:aminoglycoside phosphotransferase (APT) family kinase protein